MTPMCTPTSLCHPHHNMIYGPNGQANKTMLHANNAVFDKDYRDGVGSGEDESWLH